MSTPTPEEDSEDVNDFLQRVKELGDRRDQEDEERNRKLEEEILQGRKERQARRAERARSISPTKSSPSNTPTASRLPVVPASAPSQSLSATITPRIDAEAQPEATHNAMENPTAKPASPAKENSSPSDGERTTDDPGTKRNIAVRASPSSALPSRNTPLSWQRRPTSQSFDQARSRPLSMVATENTVRSPRATPTPEPSIAAGEQTLSRDQIAQSLASKDPAWFRQTADRGVNSPAYRRQQVEDEHRSEHGSNSRRVQMPGMVRAASEVGKMVDEEADHSTSPSRSSFSYGSSSRISYQANNKVSGVLGSPIPLTPAQRLDPPVETRSESRGLAMSPSQGRISPDRFDRAPSPTKGMGGFVQSAMMKRSDSVSKRWSVQSPPGLTRGSTIANNRNSHDIIGAIGSSRPDSMNGESSPRPSSRPTSSHSDATVTQDRPSTSSSITSGTTTSIANTGFVKPALPASRTQTPVGSKADHEDSAQPRSRSDLSPPTSPTKTMDPRRWSPTKSSWLETALNKPDSPKPKPVPAPQQPAWMAEINKAKKKGSVDLSRSPTPSHKHEISIGGLMRSPPPGGIAKPLSIGGLPSGFSSGAGTKNLPGGGGGTKHEYRNASKSVGSNDLISSPFVLGVKSSTLDSQVKPETPPKKDFRASLKSRQLPANSDGIAQPEFKNVFGQLRRTKTQNYVAPDELKDNITRGKAALNLTGGPKKTERKDEFKDAILKKKEDFKKAQIEGKGVTRSPSVGNLDIPLPEALVKQKALRSDSIITDKESNNSEFPLTRSAMADSPKPIFSAKEKTPPGRFQGKEPTVGGKLAGRLNPGLAGLLARGPPSAASETSRSLSPMSNRSLSNSTTTNPAEPGPQLTHMTKGRARGPRRKAPSGVLTSAISSQISEGSTSMQKDTPQDQDTSREQSSHDPNLHLEATEASSRDETKKPSPQPLSPRKIDSKRVEEPTSQPASPRKLNLKRRSQFLQEAPNINTKAEPQLDSPKPLSSAKKANPPEIPLKAQEPNPETEPASTPKSKPNTPIKSPSLASKFFEASTPSTFSPLSHSLETLKLRPVPSSPPKSTGLGPRIEPPLPSDLKIATPKSQNDSLKSEPSTPLETSKPRPLPLSPSKFTALNLIASSSASNSLNTSAHQDSTHVANTADKADVREPVISVKTAAAKWDRPTLVKGTESSPPVKSPIKLPTHEDEKAALINSGLRSASPTKPTTTSGLGSQSSREPTTRRLPTTPPVKTNPSLTSSTSTPSASPTKSIHSPVSQASEATKMLAEFFTSQTSVTEYAADTASILSARPDQDIAIKSLRASLYQLSNDGRKQPVPSHQERVLFEGNVYLCHHTFGTPAGKKVTEVYFWVGDRVPNNVVDDLSEVVRREAKSVGGRLVTIRQGKETPELFQALGGIIIIRRGSSNKYDSLAPHILCTRKHFGQIVFDEVDFSAGSLCTGFPYLISAQSGKSYLWKGKGSGIDELSCARLIGMDFGLGGEVEEIEDGNEPTSFLEIFGNGSQIPKSAEHWRMKPNYNKYCTRLFCADPATKQQIIEISPFCQSDFDLSKIYVLDAFFEIYIIVGSRAQSQYASFQHALVFAQEYGILAAGMEDRPFVPVTTVVLEGVPKDMKSVFRKWDDARSPTFHGTKSLQRGRSLRVVPLTVALEATKN